MRGRFHAGSRGPSTPRPGLRRTPFSAGAPLPLSIRLTSGVIVLFRRIIAVAAMSFAAAPWLRRAPRPSTIRHVTCLVVEKPAGQLMFIRLNLRGYLYLFLSTKNLCDTQRIYYSKAGTSCEPGQTRVNPAWHAHRVKVRRAAWTFSSRPSSLLTRSMGELVAETRTWHTDHCICSARSAAPVSRPFRREDVQAIVELRRWSRA